MALSASQIVREIHRANGGRVVDAAELALSKYALGQITFAFAMEILDECGIKTKQWRERHAASDLVDNVQSVEEARDDEVGRNGGER